MAVLAHALNHPRLSVDEIAAWRAIPTAMASDCRSRPNSGEGGPLAGAIKALAADTKLVGQALTAYAPLGDHSAVKAAVQRAQPGDVIVVDAGGDKDTAMMGDLFALWAQKAGVAGFVIDGAVRDVAEITELGLPCFSRGAVPRRPLSGGLGSINLPINCAGVLVAPGDLVIGDGDGVVIVPLADVEATRARCAQKLAGEAAIIAGLNAGRPLTDFAGVMEIEDL